MFKAQAKKQNIKAKGPSKLTARKEEKRKLGAFSSSFFKLLQQMNFLFLPVYKYFR